jgi:uncharacterized protein (TIGR02145 family)
VKNRKIRVLNATVLLLSVFCATASAQSAGSFTDTRDGKKYRTVKIGNQTWMAENLNYDAEGSKCYDGKPENCNKYGRLYDWGTAINACPSGWLLPSDEKWAVLENAVGGSGAAGKRLKAKSGWDDRGNGDDAYGFAATPGGLGRSDGSFLSVGTAGIWWSDSERNASEAYRRGIDYNADGTIRNSSGKSLLFSVRCVQATNAEIMKQRSLEETINRVINAYAGKDVKALNAFISKDYGIAYASRPGSTDVIELFSDIVSLNESIPLENRRSFGDTTMAGKKFILGKLPFYECGEWDIPSGIYGIKSPSQRLSNIAKEGGEFVGVPLPDKDIRKIKEIDENSYMVVAVGEEELSVFTFYLTYLNGKWYLTVIDAVFAYCDA